MENFKLHTGDGVSALTKKQIIGIIIAIIFFGYIAVGFTNPSGNKSEREKETSATLSAAKPIDPAVLEADKKHLADLKTKFDYSYDEFEQKGWYTAKSQNVSTTSDKTLLRAFVNNFGYIYLMSQYHSDDWIFHTKASVKIGDAVYETEEVPTYNSDNEETNSLGGVWETIAFTAGKDNGILKAIAESGDAPIKVRLTGDQTVKDFTLAKRDQQAIKEAYELSQLIIKVGDNESSQ